jgi:Skp family chaperone for outer membrane proteins
MQKILIGAAGALALTATGAAIGQQPGSATCYIEVRRLMADPPAGVGDLGAAIRQLDVALRPQVEELNKLKADLAAVQQRQQRAAQSEEDTSDLVDLETEARRITAEIDAKQAQLKLDYAAQQQALVAPVQSHVSERAQAFSSERGCGQMKMARQADLPGLQSASAQDVTGDFVAWYVQHKT